MSKKTKLESNIPNLDYGNLMKLKYDGNWVNYKQLCECLNIPYLTSNSKTKQLNELNAVCVIEKQGVKYKITEVRPKKEVLLFNNRSVYLPYIELILLSAFEKNKGDILFLSTKEIVNICNMINKNYQTLLNQNMYFESMLVAKANNFDHESFYKYLNKSYNSILQPIIATALGSMDKRKSISLNKGFKLYKEIKVDNSTISTYKYVLETDELGKELFKIEGDVFTLLNINGVGDLFGSQRWRQKEYYSKCNELLKNKCNNDKTWIKNHWDFDGFYRCHAIVLNENRIKTNISQLKHELNFKVQNRLLTTQTLDMLTHTDRKTFIEATISKEGESKWDFKKDIKNGIKTIDESIKKSNSN